MRDDSSSNKERYSYEGLSLLPPVIALVCIVALTGWDFDPMLKAEFRARTTGKLIRDDGVPAGAVE
jgi:Na+/H+ antiporter NhaC